MTESAQELVRREDAGAALVRPIPIPRELQELGIKVGADPESGIRVVYLPDELRRACNVVNPTTSYTQADPNWTPGISVVKLDVERDTYNVAGKRGLGKQALETLSKAAGVLYTRTARVASDELQPDEKYAYRATVGFRRSDGTIDEVTRERGWNEAVERMKIEDAVKTGPRTKDLSAEQQAAEVRKRWIAELEFGPAKTESKAINRALRAGLSIPTSLSPADAAKPFLVIGYNFTPDYNDPEIKRALVAIGMNAQAAIYGGREVSEQMPELASGDIPGKVTPGGDAETHGAVDEQGGGGGGASSQPGAPSPAAASSADEPPLEDEPALEETPIQIPDAVIDNAAATVIASNGKRIAEILALEKGPKWVAWGLGDSSTLSDEERSALELVVQHRAPELWAAHTAGAA